MNKIEMGLNDPLILFVLYGCITAMGVIIFSEIAYKTGFFKKILGDDDDIYNE